MFTLCCIPVYVWNRIAQLIGAIEFEHVVLYSEAAGIEPVVLSNQQFVFFEERTWIRMWLFCCLSFLMISFKFKLKVIRLRILT